MRLTYFDEAGSSFDGKQEPIIVVAATIIHGDLQSLAIENDANEIIARCVPSLRREGFEFHGKEMYSGSNRLRGWPKVARHKALKEFLNLIPKHNLPVVYCGLSKEALWKTLMDVTLKEEDPYLDHQIAFLFCAGRVEMWFRQNAPFERSICIGDETKAKGGLKKHLQDYRKRTMLISEDVKLDHLIDTMYFGNSEDSIFLQLADICAYFIKRRLLGKADAIAFYEIIKAQVTPQPLNIELFGYSREMA